MQVEPLSSRRAAAHTDACAAEAEVAREENQQPEPDASGKVAVKQEELDAELPEPVDQAVASVALQVKRQLDLERALARCVARLPGSMQKEQDTQDLVDASWGGMSSPVVIRAEADQHAHLACREAAALLVSRLGLGFCLV